MAVAWKYLNDTGLAWGEKTRREADKSREDNAMMGLRGEAARKARVLTSEGKQMAEEKKRERGRLSRRTRRKQKRDSRKETIT